MKRFLAIFFAVLLLFTANVFAAEKNVEFEWEQASEDLPENGGTLTGWELFSSTDPALPLDQWKSEGTIDYTSEETTYTGAFDITVPDGVETNMWFRMKALGSDGKHSDLSDPAVPAPLLIDFKPPAAPVATVAFDRATSSVTITWTQDAADTDLAAHRVFKAEASGGPYADLGVQTSPYVYDASGDVGKSLFFVVVAYDDDNNFSPNSNEVAVQVLPQGLFTPMNLKVKIVTQ